VVSLILLSSLILTVYLSVYAVQMHLEGSRIIKANNETAFNYFQKSADKVASFAVFCNFVVYFDS